MITASPAPVAPRVTFKGRHDSWPLEMVASEFSTTRDTGALSIIGGEGSGKTTALAHLAATLPDADRIEFLDEPPLETALAAAGRAKVIFTSRGHERVPKVSRTQLAPWSRDELIEYLLSVHPARCRSVMSRLSAPEVPSESPLFWSAVLDALADDEQLTDLDEAVARCLQQRLGDPDLREAARWSCLSKVLNLHGGPSLAYDLQTDLSRESMLFVQTERVAQMLAREQASRGLLSERSGELLVAHWPLDLVEAVAFQTTRASDVADVLRQSLNGVDLHLYSTAASLLVRIDPDWKPKISKHRLGLDRAYFQRVDWPGCNLAKLRVVSVDLTGAGLQRANLSNAQIGASTLFQCRLNRARLAHARIEQTSLEEADLTDAKCRHARFEAVCLHQIKAGNADFRNARFDGCDCGDADFRQAKLSHTEFEEVELAGADFTEADLTAACLKHADLRSVELAGACLHGAKLQNANIEDVDWSAPDLSQANLEAAKCTGSTLRSAILSSAVLRSAELGEINWEGADLRYADLRGATFHLGSSRSGLISSPIASEGSRTGFYTDESLEQHFQSPEEIRKANLRGADLRAAKLDSVDLYLVDLRDARLDPHQLEIAKRTGAILSRT